MVEREEASSLDACEASSLVDRLDIDKALQVYHATCRGLQLVGLLDQAMVDVYELQKYFRWYVGRM